MQSNFFNVFRKWSYWHWTESYVCVCSVQLISEKSFRIISNICVARKCLRISTLENLVSGTVTLSERSERADLEERTRTRQRTELFSASRVFPATEQQEFYSCYSIDTIADNRCDLVIPSEQIVLGILLRKWSSQPTGLGRCFNASANRDFSRSNVCSWAPWGVQQSTRALIKMQSSRGWRPTATSTTTSSLRGSWVGTSRHPSTRPQCPLDTVGVVCREESSDSAPRRELNNKCATSGKSLLKTESLQKCSSTFLRNSTLAGA